MWSSTLIWTLVGVALAAVIVYDQRCRIGWHDLADAKMKRIGDKAHTIGWECPRCFRVVAKRSYRPNPHLQRRLKANPLRSTLALVKPKKRRSA